MAKLERLQKHALECLRLEADCMQLARDARNPNLQSHFLRMAQVWRTLATSGPCANGDNFAKVGTSTT